MGLSYNAVSLQQHVQDRVHIQLQSHPPTKTKIHILHCSLVACVAPH